MTSRQLTIPFSLVLVGILSLAACEKFEPETYHMSPFDENACGILQGEQADTLRPPRVDALNPDWTPKTVAAFVGALMDSLGARGATITEGEKKYVVVPPAGADTSFLKVDLKSPEVTVFLTDVVDVVLIDGEGNVKEPVNTSIPFEVAGECPDIQARLSFSVQPGTYLLLFGLNDRTTGGPVRLTVLPGR